MSAHCAVDTLSAWIDDALEEREAERVAAHVAACPACAAELAGLRRVVEGLQSLERLAPPPALGLEVTRRVALAGRPRGLAARLAERRSGEIQSSVGLSFALVVAFALIGWLVAHGPELVRSRHLPVRFLDDPEPVAAVEAEAAVEAAAAAPQVVAGRTLVPDGDGWREAGAGPGPVRRVAIGSTDWGALVAREPELAELVVLAAPVEIRLGDELVRLEPSP